MLCEYPGFAVQVFHGGGVVVLAGVFSRLREEPLPQLETWRRADACAEARRTPCSILTYHPDAGTALAGLDIISPLLKMCGVRSHGGASHSIAAVQLVSALVRTLAVTGGHIRFIASVLERASVRRMLRGMAGVQTESELRDMTKSVHEILAWGDDGAAVASPATAIIVKLWNLHPQDFAVCKAACLSLHRCVCNMKLSADYNAHVHAPGGRWRHSKSCEWGPRARR